MTNQIVPAGPEHALQLVSRLRKGDLDEIKASSGLDPEDALLLSVATSPRSWAWVHDGEVIALFGVGAAYGRPGVGVPWLLGSPEVEKHKIYFVRNSRRHIAEMLKVFPYLENHVDCRNTPSIQWLAWCGFALAEVVPFYGAQRLPFIRFCLGRS